MSKNGLTREENRKAWLYAFLIVLGMGAVAALLERLPKEYGKDRVFLSVYDDNQGAIRLYEKLGFAFNGELDTKGERVMVYTVPRPDAPTEREERERAHDRSV